MNFLKVALHNPPFVLWLTTSTSTKFERDWWIFRGHSRSRCFHHISMKPVICIAEQKQSLGWIKTYNFMTAMEIREGSKILNVSVSFVILISVTLEQDRSSFGFSWTKEGTVSALLSFIVTDELHCRSEVQVGGIVVSFFRNLYLNVSLGPSLFHSSAEHHRRQ